MIIGSGLVAMAMIKSVHADNAVIFASGVSNSQETNEDEYRREEVLLSDHLKYKAKFIYISTIPLGDSRYMRHKKEMEQIIMNRTDNYIIVRTQHIIGKGGNSVNLLNFIKDKISKGEQITLKDGVYRSLKDVDDLVKVTDRLDNGIYDFAHVEYLRIDKLADMIGRKVGKKPIYNLVQKDPELLTGNSLEVTKILRELNIKREGYTKRVLNKYL